MKNYANPVERVHGGLVFDLGLGRTETVWCPDGVSQGDKMYDARFFENITYRFPQLEIGEDGTTHATPGAWLGEHKEVVRYDTDPESVDRRNMVLLRMSDGSLVATFDHNIPAGATREKSK